MDPCKYVPPWIYYKEVAALVNAGEFEGALALPEVAFIDQDLRSWVEEAIMRPGHFESLVVLFLDEMAGIKRPATLEERIYQRWAGYPQIKAMLGSTYLPKECLLKKIRAIMAEYDL